MYSIFYLLQDGDIHSCYLELQGWPSSLLRPLIFELVDLQARGPPKYPNNDPILARLPVLENCSILLGTLEVQVAVKESHKGRVQSIGHRKSLQLMDFPRLCHLGEQTVLAQASLDFEYVRRATQLGR